jgi:phospholipid/cholesterol/gamma-HCH transport system substrate-binding protein
VTIRLNKGTIRHLIYMIIFAIVTTVLTAFLAFAITNSGIGGSYRTYRANFTDVTDLIPGNDVRIAGVRVGQVQSVQLMHSRYAQVTFTVQSNIPVYRSATATIRFLNLVGERYLQLSESAGGGARLPQNGLIPMSRTTPALNLTVLFNGFKPLFQALDPQDVNTLAADVVGTLQGESGALDHLMANTASLTSTIADRDAVIGQLINNLNGVLATVVQHDAGLNGLIVQMQRLVSGLAADRYTIAAALGNVNRLAISSSRFLSAVRPNLPADLAGLNGIAKALLYTKNANGRNTLDQMLQEYPTKLNTIIRTATYGSFFNFYLCDADYATPTKTGGLTYSPVRLHVNTTACNAGSGS